MDKRLLTISDDLSGNTSITLSAKQFQPLNLGEYLEIKLNIQDVISNQNLGFSRSAQGNIVTQNSYNTIRRYGMLNLIWNFTHTPAGAPAGEQNGPVIKL
jgi:hypothetical protein